MSDVFISYSRSTAKQAEQVELALKTLGYSVWRDDKLPAHGTFSEAIEENLRAARAVVAIWSADAVKSQWVRAEANVAREAGTLVQLRVDDAMPPLPFDLIQCADLKGWTGDTEAPGWRKIVASVADLTGGPSRLGAKSAHSTSRRRKLAICVLPFANMSGDPEQEYFSDGISEDIITDLSKISALSVVSRNSAFQFKGKAVDLPKVADDLHVTHVLEGSVRKAGNRVRITAQLVNGSTNGHVWAERYDRDLTDIFALQDEISDAIVKALRLKLLPKERVAISRRGTGNARAYDFYLMARSFYLTGNFGDPRREETIERLCRRAVDLDPGYAQAWALLAAAQWARGNLNGGTGRSHGPATDGGPSALGRALALNPNLPEARSLNAQMLSYADRQEEASAEIALALRLDPESFEVNRRAGLIRFDQGRFEEAVRHFERAALIETDIAAPYFLLMCYTALGDGENARRIARLALGRSENDIARDRSNGFAMGVGVAALVTLGEIDRAKDWMDRALLIDPDNLPMRYNFACHLATRLNDADAALDMLGPVLERAAGHTLKVVATDPDLACLRDNPSFKAMIAKTEARLAADLANGAGA